MAKVNESQTAGALGVIPKALRPTSNKKIRRQTLKLIRRIQRPAYKQISQQEKRIKSIDQKRKKDNEYYREWRAGKLSELEARRDASNAYQAQANEAAMAQHAKALLDLRQDIQTDLAAQRGRVGNANVAAATDTTAHAAATTAQLSNEQKMSLASAAASNRLGEILEASALASDKNLEVQRQMDTANALRDLQEERRSLRAEGRAAAAEEIARRREEEIRKAEIRMNLKGIGAQLAFDAEQMYANFNHEYNMAQAKAAIDRASKSKGLTPGQKNTNKKEARKIHRQHQRILMNGLTLVSNDPKMQKFLAGLSHPPTPQAVTRVYKWLVNKHGGEPLYARAVAEQVVYGSMTPATYKTLKQQGYRGKRKF